MKISKNLEKSSKINLWINENLAFDEKILEVLHEEVKSNEVVSWKDITYIVEFYIGQKHMSNYAMLGMEYIYKNTGKLDVKVCVSNDEGKILENTIAMPGDEVHSGIPKEYGEKILQVAASYFRVHNYGTGEIVFFMGAHGYYGSSQAVFGLATNILLNCLEKKCESDVKMLEKTVYETYYGKNRI